MQHDALDRHASAQTSLDNYLKRTGHSLELHSEECFGLVSGRIRHWIKKAFHCLALGNASCEFEREFDVELYHMDDDRELMARCHARSDTSCRCLAAKTAQGYPKQ